MGHLYNLPIVRNAKGGICSAIYELAEAIRSSLTLEIMSTQGKKKKPTN
jgi:hypothetical protein